MHATVTRTIATAVLLLLVACSSEKNNVGEPDSETLANTNSAERIYRNGIIYTVNEAQTWATAVAIRGDKFVAVGDDSSVEPFVGAGTEVIDLRGQMMLPGFFDAHIHLEEFYLSDRTRDRHLRLPPVETIEEIRGEIASFAAARPDLDVIFVTYLPNELFPGSSPTKAFLDEFLADRPVVVLTQSGHEALLNSQALEMVGIDDNTPDPTNGVIVRDVQTGKATGFLKEAAYGIYAMPYQPKLSVEEHAEGMAEAIDGLNALGITSVKHIHALPIEAEGIKLLDDRDQLNVRVSLAWTYESPLQPQSIEEQEEAIKTRARFASDLVNPNFIKTNVDGIPTGTAAMLEPYVGTADLGINFVDAEELADRIVRFDDGLDGMVFHTVGDRGARIVLDALDLAATRKGEIALRPQLAHGFFIAADDLPRLKEADLTIEFSPIMWFSGGLSESIWEAVGPNRAADYAPMRSVADEGGRVVIASDGPIFFHSPLASIESAVTRLPPDGGTSSASMDQSLTLHEAIAARTINSAYLTNSEDRLGTIEKGKLADYVIISKNIFDIPVDEISEVDVVSTAINGRIVYQAATVRH